MRKDKIANACNYLIKHCTVVFPVLVVIVAAVTVAMALSVHKVNGEENNAVQQDNSGVMLLADNQEPAVKSSGFESIAPAVATLAPETVPLTENTDEEIYNLVASYYNSMADGDTDMLAAIHDTLSTTEVLRFREMAKYIDSYKAFDIYIKQGMTSDSVLACVYYKVCFVNHEEEFPGYQMLYICKNEQGALYVKNEEGFTEEERQYILKVAAQDDVVEFNNRVDVEYQELMLANPGLLDYLGELSKQVDKSVGKALEEIGVEMAEQNISVANEDGSAPVSGSSVVNGPQYAAATTTVNVRNSDSERAEKIGKVSGGTRVQVQEVRANGWTKIVYEGKDGYIKSEYLRLEEAAADLDVVGRVTAVTNINIRSEADQGSARLGLLAAGQSLELLEAGEEWHTVNYEGQVAYVKAEYVTVE